MEEEVLALIPRAQKVRREERVVVEMVSLLGLGFLVSVFGSVRSRVTLAGPTM